MLKTGELLVGTYRIQEKKGADEGSVFKAVAGEPQKHFKNSHRV